MILSILALAAALSPEIVIREPPTARAVQTTVRSLCGTHEVVVQYEFVSGIGGGSRINEVTIGERGLSDDELGMLATAIGGRDINSSSVVQCEEQGEKLNVEIIFEVSSMFNSSKYLGLTVTEDNIKIDGA